MECLTSLSLGEDDASLAAHMRTIAEQGYLTPGKRNLVKINLAMSQTFPERRKAIVVDLVKMDWLRSKYPVLFDESQVCPCYRF